MSCLRNNMLASQLGTSKRCLSCIAHTAPRRSSMIKVHCAVRVSTPQFPKSEAVIPKRISRRNALNAKAMVNVDFASPALILGASLIGSGVLLLQLRNTQNRISRDADIIVAAMISIVGSTLIFQGWRLDPLLLLCQALTTSVAFWYGLETFRLRAAQEENEGTAALPPPNADPRTLQNQNDGFYNAETQRAFWDQAASGQVPGRWGTAPPPPSASLPPGTQQSFNDAVRYYDYYGNLVDQYGTPIQEPVSTSYTAYPPSYGPRTSSYDQPTPAEYTPLPNTINYDQSSSMQYPMPPSDPSSPPASPYSQSSSYSQGYPPVYGGQSAYGQPLDPLVQQYQGQYGGSSNTPPYSVYGESAPSSIPSPTTTPSPTSVNAAKGTSTVGAKVPAKSTLTEKVDDWE